MKGYILIKRENLQELIENAHKWHIIEEFTNMTIQLKPEDWDAATLEYCESQGLIFPPEFSGRDALDVLIHYDTDFYESEGEQIYDKREND
jgi:hypothetical protein